MSPEDFLNLLWGLTIIAGLGLGAALLVLGVTIAFSVVYLATGNGSKRRLTWDEIVRAGLFVLWMAFFFLSSVSVLSRGAPPTNEGRVSVSVFTFALIAVVVTMSGYQFFNIWSRWSAFSWKRRHEENGDYADYQDKIKAAAHEPDAHPTEQAPSAL